MIKDLAFSHQNKILEQMKHSWGGLTHDLTNTKLERKRNGN
jgi:hypothetical protein